MLKNQFIDPMICQAYLQIVFCNKINRKCAVINKPVKSTIMLNVTNNKMVVMENIINDSTIYFMIQITK